MEHQSRLRLSSGLSDTESDAADDDEETFEYTGADADASYSSRMEELLGDDEDEGPEHGGDIFGAQEGDDEEGGFLYTGVDALDTSITGYKNRLRDVLGPDDSDISDDSGDENEVEKSLMAAGSSSSNGDREGAAASKAILETDDEPLPEPSENAPSTPSQTQSILESPSRVHSPSFRTPYDSTSANGLARPFLHPTVSRLRSFTPQSSRVPSAISSAQSNSYLANGLSPSPSHFSAMSPTSSVSGLPEATNNRRGKANGRIAEGEEREVFRWASLRGIGNYLYSQGAQKAASILGSPSLGLPTVLAANGLICIGTEEGKVVVYDFKQTLKCICGGGSAEKAQTGGGASPGPVTALALSHDHTHVAVGHASGHIQLFDMKNPSTPARSVPPTNLAAIRSGRKEGHLKGSRIVNVGFIAGRHTAIVSADEHGLAFYHSLGKVLFVEASDILRILGKYPEVDMDDSVAVNGKTRKHQNGSAPLIPPRKPRYRVLAMAPLPLGTASHPTDTYHVVALLTPTKLVAVALKPTPRTWFKCPRDFDDEKDAPSMASGSLAWYPSVTGIAGNPETDVKPKLKKGEPVSTSQQTTPTLVYSWGKAFSVIRVSESKIKQSVRNSKTGKMTEIDVGHIVQEKVGKWTASDEILALQWLNSNQVVIVTRSTIDLFDLTTSTMVESVSFAGSSLRSALKHAEPGTDVSHSVRAYKGKIFLLGKDDLRVGSLLTWADRILSLVNEGDFLKAIDLTRSYYIGEALGNRNGLPTEPQARKDVIGEKVRELMSASARYAFSEDRMRDATHHSADGRGVDRTTLFESLVVTCAKACIAIDDFDFLFEDLFQQYDDTGIARIYLLQLEKFILDGTISYVPPWIVQRLLNLQEEDRRPDLVERIIWHIDPTCLDINQAIGMCQRHGLYDALIYVYTRGLKDYVAPIVELLGLIRRVQKHRHGKRRSLPVDAEMETVIMNAYKVYPYMANVLSGLTYPSEEPLEEAEAHQAKKDVFSFIFDGHSRVWPSGEGGKLVLTSNEDGVQEPTYPYTRLLLLYDPESFLHSLDIVFEDPYLNDEFEGGRFLIVRILLDILSSGDLSPASVTFVNIFIARNVPKYPQYLFQQFPPTQLHGILIGLAEDPDENTREDRQLAAEYLLSVYNPHDSELIQGLFESAGFYRILRTWHRQDRQWASLLSTYVNDTDLVPTEMFSGVNEALKSSTRGNKGTLPTELLAAISDALPSLLRASAGDTAILVDTHAPSMHDEALENLDDDRKRHLYLQCLLRPQADLDGHSGPLLPRPSSPRLEDRHRQLFVSLQCQFNPPEVMDVLKSFSSCDFDWSQAIETCEKYEVYDAAVWCLDWQDNPIGALAKAEVFEKRLTLDIVRALTEDPASSDAVPNTSDILPKLESLQAVGRTGVDICLRRSQAASSVEVPLEDIWFQLLSSQINCVQNVSASCSHSQDQSQLKEIEQSTLSTLRSLLQETFLSLVSISSTRAVSFPRLFKRLVDPKAHPATPDGSQYSEFRTILTGMLESYRSDEEILHITKRLIERDLFDVMATAAQERVKGWAPPGGTCCYCRNSLLEKPALPLTTTDSPTSPPEPPSSSKANNVHLSSLQIVISRTGAIYHSLCRPPDAS